MKKLYQKHPTSFDLIGYLRKIFFKKRSSEESAPEFPSFSLRKSKHVLRNLLPLFMRKKKHLCTQTKQDFEQLLKALQNAISLKNRQDADLLAKNLLSLSGAHLKKSGWDQLREIVFALAFALSVAIIVRQMWFEPYEIPTGSMRPTLKEKDRLIVTKSDFGINLPLYPAHLYFDPNLVKRNGIIVFTGEKMDIRDVNTLYFYIFPGKKQYIKRLIGKPGDVLYFYGGEIYGIDKEGKNITPELQLDRLSRIEHIPFIDFDKKIVIPPAPLNGIFSPVFFYQMNQPIAKLSMHKNGQITGEMLETPSIHVSEAPLAKDYFDLWGMKNFGMGRLLTKGQVEKWAPQDAAHLEEGILYLEITHHPSLSHAKIVRDELGRFRPALSKSTSLLPLNEQHVRNIFENIYTARFCVKNGIAYRYGSKVDAALKNSYAVHLDTVPDGCYEFYYGKAYEVKWEGITVELPPSHPLYQYSPELVQLLYNVGIEWDMRFMPQYKDQRIAPSRYVYFRNADLYLLGAPILKKADPVLTRFLEREKEKTSSHYFPFEDAGPPLRADGSIDINFIQQHGLLIPEKSYLALGDNHAMSSDSRDFGFVPEANLRGAPDFIFWPPGNRFGIPNQPSYALFTLPRAIIWLAASVAIIWCIKRRKKKNRLLNDVEN